MARFIPMQMGKPKDHVEADYKGVCRYGSIGLGERYLFQQGLLYIRYLPLEDIVWAYLRQEDSRITLCCGKGTLPSYYLMVVTGTGQQLKLAVDRKEEAQAALESLQSKDVKIQTGFYPDLQQRFAGQENR